MQTTLTSRRIGHITTGIAWLAAAVIFPILVHLIPPHNGIPIGAYLLPMFYIPLIALWLASWRVAISLAILAPLLNFMLTGSPQTGIMYMLTIEVFIFTCVAAFLLNSSIRRFAGPVSYVITKLLSTTLLAIWPLLPAAPTEFLLNSLQNGAPGILVLLTINLLLVKFFPKAG